MSTFKILLVDDEPAFSKAQMRILKTQRISPKHHFDCVNATRGEEGYRLLEHGDYDCVLIDHDMPEGSGIEWLKKMLLRWPDLPVIMVTGNGCESVAVEALKDGAVDYLIKGSISPEMLVKSIVHAIQKNEMTQLIAEQKRELFEAERQRIMIESLGAACHHLGQPLHTLTLYLEMLLSNSSDEENTLWLEECIGAADQMAEILEKLRHLKEYRTVPYLKASEQEDVNIIKI